MIELTGVTKRFRQGKTDVIAVDRIDLEVAQGEIFGIVGLSGAGKSTLIRCINMLERPQQGSIRIDGVEMTRLPERALRKERQKIGMIFQQFNLMSARTVVQNVAFPLEIAGVAKAEIDRRVTELLDLVGLADRAGAYPSQLSGGQKQRVGIARSLANRPKVLLSDEATSSLDPKTTRDILQLLGDINRKLGLTILLITHEMEVIKEVCHQVAVIEGGKIVEQGSVLEVFSRPKTDSVRHFVLGAFNAAADASDATAADTSVAINGASPSDGARPMEDGRPPGDGDRTERGYPEGDGIAPGSLTIRVRFVGEEREGPFLSTLARRFALELHVLSAHIDRVQGVPFGVLELKVQGTGDSVQEALRYIEASGFEMEVVAGVHADGVADAV